MTARAGPARRVLIVDDDPNVRQLLRVLCELNGYYCVGEAEDGAEVERLCRRYQPDLVILDYMMPVLDGAETSRIIRQVSPHTKILGFSAVLDAEPEWADGFLDKTRIDRIGEALDALYSDNARSR